MKLDNALDEGDRAAEAVKWGMRFAKQIIADSDWDDTIDVMLGREWEARDTGIPWEEARPLVKRGWLRGRERI